MCEHKQNVGQEKDMWAETYHMRIKAIHLRCRPSWRSLLSNYPCIRQQRNIFELVLTHIYWLLAPFITFVLRNVFNKSQLGPNVPKPTKEIIWLFWNIFKCMIGLCNITGLQASDYYYYFKMRQNFWDKNVTVNTCLT